MSILELIDVMTEESEHFDVKDVGRQIVSADKYVFTRWNNLVKCDGEMFEDTVKAISSGEIKIPGPNLLCSSDDKRGMFHIHAAQRNDGITVCTLILETHTKKGTRYTFAPFQVYCDFKDGAFRVEDWGPDKEKWANRKHDLNMTSSVVKVFVSCLILLNRKDLRLTKMVESNSDLMAGEPIDKVVIYRKVEK